MGQSGINAYHHLLFASRNEFANEPAVPMFNRWAIQHKVIVVSWRSLATHANLRPRRRIVNELCAYAGLPLTFAAVRTSGREYQFSRTDFSTGNNRPNSDQSSEHNLTIQSQILPPPLIPAIHDQITTKRRSEAFSDNGGVTSSISLRSVDVYLSCNESE
jgi:hypothetical protein